VRPGVKSKPRGSTAALTYRYLVARGSSPTTRRRSWGGLCRGCCTPKYGSMQKKIVEGGQKRRPTATRGWTPERCCLYACAGREKTGANRPHLRLDRGGTTDENDVTYQITSCPMFRHLDPYQVLALPELLRKRPGWRDANRPRPGRCCRNIARCKNLPGRLRAA
jgi:hypothetical protein